MLSGLRTVFNLGHDWLSAVWLPKRVKVTPAIFSATNSHGLSWTHLRSHGLPLYLELKVSTVRSPWSSVCHAATYLLAAGCPIPSFSGFSYFYRGLGGSHGILNVASPRRPNDLYQLTRRSAQLRSPRVSDSILWPVRHTLPTFTRCSASAR